MATFTSLPKEIRLNVIDLVLGSCRAVPDPSQTNLQEDRQTLHDFDHNGWWAGQNRAWESDPELYQSNAKSLLQVNQQLRGETRSLYSRYSSYVLDVLILNEQTLCPTWLSLPFRTQHVETIHAAIRMHGVSAVNGRSGFQGGDGGPPRIVWPGELDPSEGSCGSVRALVTSKESPSNPLR